jgi:outer membrane protein assembly factor BamB
MYRWIALTLCLIALAGCSKQKEPIHLEGERETILLQDDALKVNASVTHIPVTLPHPIHNTAWSQAGGRPDHAMPPVALPSHVTLAWERDIGGGSSGDRRLLVEPVVAEERVYALNTAGEITAFSTRDGEHLWSTNVMPEHSSGSMLGGGLAYDNGTLFAATSFAEIVACDAKTGAIKWRAPLNSPARSAPTLGKDHLFIVTINNQTEAFNIKTGELLWSHSGMMESAGLLGGASPALHNNVLLAPYSSGEIYALRADNGHPLWSESLATTQRLDLVSSLAHIRARPVIAGGQAFLISHSGRMSAIDMRSGNVVWNRTIGGIHSPAMTDKFLFMLTINNELVCLTRDQGLVRWVQPLPRYDDAEKKTNLIHWAGPILAGEQLIVVGSHGEALMVRAHDGMIAHHLPLHGSALLPPIVADKTLYILTDDGKLAAYR